VIPIGSSYVARQLVKLGDSPHFAGRITTDNGNPILDVHGLSIFDPPELETEINQNRRRSLCRFICASSGRCVDHRQRFWNKND